MAKKEKKEKKKGGTEVSTVEVAETPHPTPRLLEKYRKEIHPALKKRFGCTNDLAVPRVEKVVLNMGIGKAVENKNRVDHAVRDLTQIAGQKPVVTKARKSIAGFKLRQDMPIGAMVTLRKDRMYEFLDRLISTAVPRIRDFRGLTRSFDGSGNYSMGVTEQAVFSEVNLDKLEFTQGLQVTVVTSAKNDEEGHALLEAFGFPFRK